MLSNVKCPNCGHSIELTEAVKKEWEAEFTKKDEQKRKEELARAVKNAEVKAFEKVTQDFNIKLKQSIEEASEEKERNRKLLTDLSENNKLIRELKRKNQEFTESIEKILNDLEKSQIEIDKYKSELTTLRDELVHIKIGIVEINYLQYSGRNLFPNPYHERIMAKLNDLLVIAVPDSSQRAVFVQELQQYTQDKVKK